MTSNPNPKPEKKEIHLDIQDWAFLTVLLFLFLIVIIHSISPEFAILFVTQISPGETVFSLLSVTLVFLGGILWGSTTFIRRHPKTRGSAFQKQFLLSMPRFVGIRRIGLKGALLITLAFVIGVLFNTISTVAIGYFVKGYVSLSSTAIAPYNIATYLIGSPIIEELTYRAIFIGFFLQVFGKNRWVAIIALVMSSFVFGFTHIGPTWYLLVKTGGGLMLGSIYLTRCGRNYFNSLATHIGLNVVGIFTVIGT